MSMTVGDDGRAPVNLVIISSLEPLGDEQFDELGLPGLIEARDGILRIEAQEMTPTRGYTPAEASEATPGEFNSIIARDAEAARGGLKTARRRKVTRELMANVLDLYDKGGIAAVMEGTHYSESYSFKLLRRARQEQSE